MKTDSFEKVLPQHLFDDTQKYLQKAKYQTVEEWMLYQPTLRIKLASLKLQIPQDLLINQSKQQLIDHFSSIPIDQLKKIKQILKMELFMFENDFMNTFYRKIDKNQKLPLKSVYFYYNQLKAKIKDETLKKIEKMTQKRQKLKKNLQNQVQSFEAAHGRTFDKAQDRHLIKNECILIKNMKYEIIAYKESIGKK